MKITVGPTNNLVFQQPTDRGRSAQITVTGGGGGSLANQAYAQANAAYNSSNNAANTVRVSANGASTLSKQQLNFVNTAAIIVNVEPGIGGNANISFTTGAAAVGDAYGQANAARQQANVAYGQANAAYSEANTKLSSSGGILSGNLTITGNLEVLGNSTILNVETLIVEDNEIILNGNVSGSPTLNAFLTVNRGTSSNVSLKWNEDNNKWEWTDNGTEFYSLDTALTALGAANNRVLRAGDTMTGNLNVSAWLITQNVIPTDNNLYSLGTPTNRFKDLYLSNSTLYIGETIISGQTGEVRSDTFNAAVSFISGGLNVLDQANVARTTANDAYNQANVARTTANDAYNTANSSGLNALFAYGQANAARTQANTAYAQANAAYADANTRVLKSGDTMTGTLTINTGGVGLNVTSNIEVGHSVDVKNTVNANTITFGRGIYDLTSNSFQTNSNDPVEVDSFPSSSFSTVKYIVQIKTVSSIHSTELFCIQDGLSTYMTEYATLISGAPLGTFSINLSDGRMRLIFDPDNPLNHIMNVKVVRYTISS
jgi:hypothetical protein